MSGYLASSEDKGAHFFRCDLQVHSPRDRQWSGQPRVSNEDRAEYAASLIAACRAKGLDAIAVTDHHDMAFILHVRQAAAEETDAEGNPLQARDRIVVFPGIELLSRFLARRSCCWMRISRTTALMPS